MKLTWLAADRVQSNWSASREDILGCTSFVWPFHGIYPTYCHSANCMHRWLFVGVKWIRKISHSSIYSCTCCLIVRLLQFFVWLGTVARFTRLLAVVPEALWYYLPAAQRNTFVWTTHNDATFSKYTRTVLVQSATMLCSLRTWVEPTRTTARGNTNIPTTWTYFGAQNPNPIDVTTALSRWMHNLNVCYFNQLRPELKNE